VQGTHFLVSSAGSPPTSAMFGKLSGKSLVPRVENSNLKRQGADCENNSQKRQPLEPIDFFTISFVVHFILSLENKMKTIKGVLTEVISRSIVDRAQNDKEVMLSVTLFLALFIATQFIKI
jgi:hypothetical protein